MVHGFCDIAEVIRYFLWQSELSFLWWWFLVSYITDYQRKRSSFPLWKLLSFYQWKLFWLKCSLGDPSFLRKTGHYFKKNCAYLVSLCLHEQVGDMIVDGWPQFECNFNVFANIILPHSSHCIHITASPKTYQWRYRHVVVMLCDWLRALVHLHCDIMITTSTTKTWWSCRSLGVDLPCLRKKISHQNTMWTRWKVCKF